MAPCTAARDRVPMFGPSMVACLLCGAAVWHQILACLCRSVPLSHFFLAGDVAAVALLLVVAGCFVFAISLPCI